jgi:4a-hydroxytetrahydrobiopterin dehydratase
MDKKQCQPCEAGATPIQKTLAKKRISELKGWVLNENSTAISRRFTFKNYLKTISFVNAVAWIANQQGHHPDMAVGYAHCQVIFTTHSISGLSENDFICANLVDGLDPG